MRIISFIEEEEIIKKILLHLNLWMTKNHDPPPNDKIHQQIHNPQTLETNDNLYEPVYDYFPQMPYED